VGETRVDLLHLLEDLRDAYPGATEETILTEMVANALDSGARTIDLTTEPAQATFTIVDDGMGMRRRELARYHDLAASAKVRGAGIGFAGVGIKIGLLVCEEVVTETRHGTHHVATVWRLASHHRAPWKWVPPPGLVAHRGTAVRLKLDNALSPLLDAGFIEAALRRHFEPLVHPALTDILATHYPDGVRFRVNGNPVEKQGWNVAQTAALAVRLPRKRKPAAVGFMVRDRLPLPEDRRGIAISTFGKVIRRGWDWLGVTPGSPEYVGGLMEVPALAECLTLNKADFIRAGSRGAVYLAYRKAIQEAVTRQLAEWGDAREASERERRRAARPVERDLETVLMDLADQFPLLSTLVEHRTGGQRRLPIGRAGPDPGEDQAPGPALTSALEAFTPTAQPATADGGPPPFVDGRQSDEESHRDAEGSSPPTPHPAEARLPASRGARRPGRYGLNIQFHQRPDDNELARLVESTVWVNEAHPAYRRAAASRSEGYHVALASAMALAPLAVEPSKEHAFVIAFLTSWGAAIERRKPGRRRR
jgi:Histidine kinase-, DNA gyrase B-, and HSP90-like ATPase